MSTRHDWALRLIVELAEAATGDGGGYTDRDILMARMDIHSAHTFYEIVTLAAVLVKDDYPGYAIAVNRADGWRLLDEINARDTRMERGRLRKARTVLKRTAVVLGAGRNSEVLKMVGRQLELVVETIIEPALESLDRIVGE